MARAKKTQRKTSKKKTTKANAPEASEIKVPSGFKAVSGAFAPTWNPAENEDQPQEIVGIWGKERTVSIKRGRGVQEQRVVNIQTDDDAWTVWCSVGLTSLFDEAEEGDEVYIRFDGLGQAKGRQNPPKLFTTAIAE